MALIFDPDPELGPDPLDNKQVPRRLGEFFDSAAADTFLVVREYGERFDGGSRTHVFTSGAWQNVRSKAIGKIIRRLGEL